MANEGLIRAVKRAADQALTLARSEGGGAGADAKLAIGRVLEAAEGGTYHVGQLGSTDQVTAVYRFVAVVPQAALVVGAQVWLVFLGTDEQPVILAASGGFSGVVDWGVFAD